MCRGRSFSTQGDITSTWHEVHCGPNVFGWIGSSNMLSNCSPPWQYPSSISHRTRKSWKVESLQCLQQALPNIRRNSLKGPIIVHIQMNPSSAHPLTFFPQPLERKRACSAYARARQKSRTILSHSDQLVWTSFIYKLILHFPLPITMPVLPHSRNNSPKLTDSNTTHQLLSKLTKNKTFSFFHSHWNLVNYH